MNKFKTILFDLDGTLIDTTPLILESFRHTFLYQLNEQKEDAELMRFLGIPLRKPFEELHPGMEDLMMRTYRAYNEERHDYCIGLFIDVFSTLKHLRDSGVILGVVTSKRRELALRGLKLFGLDEFMSVFIGMEDTTRHKPEGEPVLKALEMLGIKEKQSVLYVGDSPYDILCARNAGVKSGAVSWSYLSREELMESKPDFYLESPKDLLKYT